MSLEMIIPVIYKLNDNLQNKVERKRPEKECVLFKSWSVLRNFPCEPLNAKRKWGCILSVRNNKCVQHKSNIEQEASTMTEGTHQILSKKQARWRKASPIMLSTITSTLSATLSVCCRSVGIADGITFHSLPIFFVWSLASTSKVGNLQSKAKCREPFHENLALICCNGCYVNWSLWEN